MLIHKGDLQAALGVKAPLASPTFTGSVTAPKLALGAGTVGASCPSNALFGIAPSNAIPPTVGVDIIGHVRQTVFSGDWTVSVDIAVTATGGTLGWNVGGLAATTAYNATPSAVQTALQALATVGATNSLTVAAGTSGATYRVTYNPIFIAKNGYLPLTLMTTSLTGSATLSWNNAWGTDTGFLVGENGYHVTGASPNDGNGIGVLYGNQFEVCHKSSGAIGTLIGVDACAAFQGAGATGSVDTIVSLHATAVKTKDGCPPLRRIG
jgi:hypothetical protein